MNKPVHSNRKFCYDIAKYRNKGYLGLSNLGNTCFLNTCMQVLNHVYELNEVFLVKQMHTTVTHPETSPHRLSQQLVAEWVELQQLLWSEQSSNSQSAVSPNKFVHFVHRLAHLKNKDLFTGWAQNDMPEFLLFIMECFHDSIARGVKMQINGKRENDTDKMAVMCYEMLQKTYRKEYSEVMELFYGIYVSEIRSLGAGLPVHSQTAESFFMIDLPIPTTTSSSTPVDIYQCFDLYVQKERLEGDNAWFNESTNQKESVTKQIRFWNFPPILVISLKRFSAVSSRKRQDQVNFPLTNLDLSTYVCGYDPKKYVYDLFGVCNHMGGVAGGHYTAYVKNANQEWMHYNDMQVSKVENVEDIVRPSAYCLFYRMRTKEEA